jgi:hypothetical protein
MQRIEELEEELEAERQNRAKVIFVISYPNTIKQFCITLLLHSFMVVRVFKQNASYFTMAMAS